MFKVIFKLDEETYKRKNSYYLYDSIKRLLLNDNRFPFGLKEIGQDYFICYETELEKFKRKILSEVPGVISCTIEKV